MGDKSSIEWTDATWNPVRGCSIVSKGCTNCYAMKMAHRSSGAGGAYEGLTMMSKGGPVWTGKIRLVRELLEQPLKWKRPRRIFVNSMSDLFHEDVPDDFIDEVLAIVLRCEVRGLGHTFQLLTKRPARMQRFIAEALPTPPRNLWLGVSVEDQAAADERIPLLLRTPAAVRWISAEPLLGPVEIFSVATGDLLYSSGDEYNPGSIDWIVAGGESGPGARPMHPDWARSLRDQCAAAHDGVPFFFKQWGSWKPCGKPPPHAESEHVFGDGVGMLRRPKKIAGRELDGRTHDEYPA